jgi:hypothetical protein
MDTKIGRRDIQHNDTQHINIQHRGLICDTQHGDTQHKLHSE